MEVFSKFCDDDFKGAKVRATLEYPKRVSVYDAITAITSNTNPYQTFVDLRKAFPEVLRLTEDFKFPGRGQRDTPVTDAKGLVLIMNLLPGERAAKFRAKEADVIVRYLGGDQSLVAEIKGIGVAQASLPEEHPMRLFGEAVEAREPTKKRVLEEEDDVYAARKQQLLKKIRQETACTDMTIVREHAQGSMGLLDILSAGDAPPATLQLLQTIRHNLAARIGSMMENGVRAIMAPEAPQDSQPQQQQLSVNEQAQRWTVQMFAHKLQLPAAEMTTERLKAVGLAVSKIWCRERGLMTIEKAGDRMNKVWWDTDSNVPKRAIYVQQAQPDLFGAARMKYSLAYKGGFEASDRANFDTWTYPADMGTKILQEAFDRISVIA